MEFTILKTSRKSRARIGILHTPHGEVETPAFVPVATNAVIKTLTSEEVKETGSQLLIANTFHLHLKPGERIIRRHGGIHAFMGWNGPIMTDSGGFQVFSLGFGADLNVGKVIKYFPEKKGAIVKDKAQPNRVTITDEGAHFKSPLDGSDIFIGPGESIKIQESIGADIIFAFDECTPPLATFAYVKRSLERTHRWAKICLNAKTTSQALFGIVQGSHREPLRKRSAGYVGSMAFDGFGIGGDLGHTKKDMRDILRWTIPLLPEKKPRHLLGIGYLEDIGPIIKEGIDTFDCKVPTHYARHGIAFTHKGEKLDLHKSIYLKEKRPIDPSCDCETCTNYSRGYIAHLMRAHEITALRLLTFHNLKVYNDFVAKIREKIKRGLL